MIYAHYLDESIKGRVLGDKIMVAYETLANFAIDRLIK